MEIGFVRGDRFGLDPDLLVFHAPAELGGSALRSESDYGALRRAGLSDHSRSVYVFSERAEARGAAAMLHGNERAMAITGPAEGAWALSVLHQHSDFGVPVVVDLRSGAAERITHPFIEVRNFAEYERLIGLSLEDLFIPATGERAGTA